MYAREKTQSSHKERKVRKESVNVSEIKVAQKQTIPNVR